MAQLAVLEISTGSFATGFAVRLQVSEDGSPSPIVRHGQLPPAPEVLSRYESWQMGYRSRGAGFRQIQAVPSSTRQRSNLKVLASELEAALNDWLDSGGAFQTVRDQLLKTFATQEPVRLIIQADRLELWQLPWELWHLVQEHSHVGVALSQRDCAPIQPVASPRSTVRILALLGDSTDINIQADLELLRQHLPPTAEIYAPQQVERSQLSDDLWTQPWDILFFAGHSSSRAGEGKFYLTADRYLMIDDLKYALNHAIAQGLQLAIFNSCDGLQLARDLAELQLPATIVMREPIPDEAAQKFLGYFLQGFAAEGRSLYGAVHYARQRLQGLEDKYPCVSWLPLICQNPGSPMLEWRSFLPIQPLPELPVPLPQRGPAPRLQRLKLRSVLAISLGVTCLVMGVRFLGKLESLELLAYDHLLRLRPPERLDDRILIIEANQEDMKQHNQSPLSDAVLAEAIGKIALLKPRAIGVDIYRPTPVLTGRKQLLQQFAQNKNLVGVCVQSNLGDQGIAPPPGLSKQQLEAQIGTADLLYDEDDHVRRQYFWNTPQPGSQCPGDHYSFSFVLAQKFLAEEGYQSNPDTGEMQFRHPERGTVVFSRMLPRTGGYQHREGRANQVLLNYRAPSLEGQIARKIVLEDVLRDRLTASDVRGKIVLLGVTEVLPDNHNTPYGSKRGLWIHAQSVSAILSQVKKERPPLWVLSQWGSLQWGDAVWIGVWSMASGVLVWSVRPRWQAALMGIGCMGGLYGSCWLLLIGGGWMPLIPTAIAVAGTIAIALIAPVSYKFFKGGFRSTA
jgi:CHASE2 domain-containing sensor protein